MPAAFIMYQEQCEQELSWNFSISTKCALPYTNYMQAFRSSWYLDTTLNMEGNHGDLSLSSRTPGFWKNVWKLEQIN